jgi:epoxyqueuosine reductase
VDAAEAIRARAFTLGFDAVGFAPAAFAPEARTRLRDFLAAGHHGEMGWLAEREDQRAAPAALWPDVRSVISLGLSYAPAGDATWSRECSNISRSSSSAGSMAK